MLRDDLSTKLIHLVRGDDYKVAAEMFRTIIKDGVIVGGNTMIKGMYRCVCFSETPVSKLASALALSLEQGGIRYKAFGVMVDKTRLFERGGRPVIYQSVTEFEALPESHRYRHVTYHPPQVDWTWEREWRIRTDVLKLDPATTTFVVPDRRWSQAFQQEHIESVAFVSDLVGQPVANPMPWHFIALSDLGVEIPWVQPP